MEDKQDKPSAKEIKDAYSTIARYRGKIVTAVKQDAARKNGCFGGRPAKIKKAQDAMHKIRMGVRVARIKARRAARK